MSRLLPSQIKKQFAKKHLESNTKLEVQRKSTSTNQCCYFTSQNEPLHKNIKIAKTAQKTDQSVST